MRGRRFARFTPAVVVVALAACTSSTSVSTSDPIAPLTTDPPARAGSGSAVNTLPIIPTPAGIGTAPVTVPGPLLPLPAAPVGGRGAPAASVVEEPPTSASTEDPGVTDPAIPTSVIPSPVPPSSGPPIASSASLPPSTDPVASTTTTPAPTTSGAAGPAAVDAPAEEQVIVFGPIDPGWVFGETRVVVVRATSGLLVELSTTGSCAVLDAAAGVVAATDVGSCRITARQAGDSRWAPAPEVSRRSTIGKATPVVGLPPTRVFEYPQAPMTIALTATSTSDGVLRYRLVDDAAGACGLNGSSLSFHPVAALPAQCVVEVSVPATDRHLDGGDVMTIEITPTLVEVTAADAAVAADGSSVTVHVTTGRPWPIEMVPVDGACAAAGSSAAEAAEHHLTVALLATPCTLRVTPHFWDDTAVLRSRDVVIPAPVPAEPPPADA